MAQETQDVEEKKWPSHIEHLFIDLMVDEQQKGNMEHGVFKAKVWLSITKTLNEHTGKGFTPKQVKDKHNRLRQKQRKWGQLLRHTGLGWDETTQTVTASDEVWANVIAGDNKAAALRKKGCPDYEKLKQLFAPNTATGSLQISSNTPAPDSDEERVLEEELANEEREAHRTQLDDDDCYNPNMEGVTQDDPTVDEQTQRADKSPMQEPSTKGKKVAKKNDRASEMTMALQEYTALARERFSKKKGKSFGSSDHVAQSASGGDPCSLGRALEVLNQYTDLDDDTYLNVAEALQKKEK
ncbi:uncharacterized protein LOC126707304 isoform X1 [Quercus robur]|uniref:uncharacterized protein LOC126707304 isoform X1 n=1 Tax=Quercus robur TaxID=38942 RepID=UPI0021618100|nr:uncharacterized protein LOC126707304 isoform X1 [Quercus robur]